MAAIQTVSQHDQCMAGRAPRGTQSASQILPPTSSIPRRAAAAISRLRAGITAIDPTPLRLSEQCSCAKAQSSARHTLMDCREPNVVKARTTLLAKNNGPTTWESLTENDIRLKELILYMATTDLLQVRQIITNDQDARDAEYELGEDV
ncbi:hypothetical protein Q9L58_010631 [Maublancomyces gigas]|uniref:Uncharacterized protein n=1 Tax=Discina gigas TaxID=1032678 RepID=A0ABR3G4J0_9PEZI